MEFLSDTEGRERYARALRGKRTYAPKPPKEKNIALIGAMTLAAGFIAGFSFEGELMRIPSCGTLL
jgi:lipid-binding SYLF domain-containing protein